MQKLFPILALSILGFALPHAQKVPDPPEFFPLHPSTYWVYKGTVRWYDNETEKEASQDVTWRMTVERVIRRKSVVAAIVTGFPGDLDFSAGTAEPKPWLFLETEDHRIYYENLGPGYDLSRLDGDDHVFDKFMVDDNLFFQWPLHEGAKFCDEEAKKREDGLYCWVVTEAKAAKLQSLAGASGGRQQVYKIQFHTLPDDTTMELVPGIGLLSYSYHHHGTVADTELQLSEFHLAPEPSAVQESRP